MKGIIMTNQAKRVNNTTYNIADSLNVKTVDVLRPIFTDHKSFYGKAKVLGMADGAKVLYSNDRKMAVIRDGVLKISSQARIAKHIEHVLEFIYQYYSLVIEYRTLDDLMARFGNDNDIVFGNQIALVVFM